MCDCCCGAAAPRAQGEGCGVAAGAVEERPAGACADADLRETTAANTRTPITSNRRAPPLRTIGDLRLQYENSRIFGSTNCYPMRGFVNSYIRRCQLLSGETDIASADRDRGPQQD